MERSAENVFSPSLHTYDGKHINLNITLFVCLLFVRIDGGTIEICSPYPKFVLTGVS